LLREWPTDGPKLLWQLSDIGNGYATPAVAGTRVFLLSNRGMENESVVALSVQDGKPVWSTRIGNVGSPNQSPPYPMARSTPTVDAIGHALGSDGDIAVWKRLLAKFLAEESPA
jgi:outer membrane protein assembly factor BamB